MESTARLELKASTVSHAAPTLFHSKLMARGRKAVECEKPAVWSFRKYSSDHDEISIERSTKHDSIKK